MNDKEQGLVPKEKVIDDMYSDGLIRDSARQYYYRYYASPEERRYMDKEDKQNSIICVMFWILYLSAILGSGIWAIIEHLM